MNPNAREWKPNFSAPVFAPGAGLKPAPVPVQPESIIVKPPPVPEENLEDEEPIDEEDPLWKATLQLTLGDRQKAIKLLEDPDALMQYPEIKKIMLEQSIAEDDWESNCEKSLAPVETLEPIKEISNKKPTSDIVGSSEVSPKKVSMRYANKY